MSFQLKSTQGRSPYINPTFDDLRRWLAEDGYTLTRQGTPHGRAYAVTNTRTGMRTDLGDSLYHVCAWYARLADVA